MLIMYRPNFFGGSYTVITMLQS